MTSPDLQVIERKLEQFIADELVDERYDGRDPLATGAVDSLGLEQLVDYIELEFELAFADGELRGESFESVSALAALIDSKRRSAAL